MPAQEDLIQSATDSGAQEDQKEGTETPSPTALDLHRVLLETTIANGKLICGACGHEYAIKEGIANFLLPSHMV